MHRVKTAERNVGKTLTKKFLVFRAAMVVLASVVCLVFGSFVKHSLADSLWSEPPWAPGLNNVNPPIWNQNTAAQTGGLYVTGSGRFDANNYGNAYCLPTGSKVCGADNGSVWGVVGESNSGYGLYGSSVSSYGIYASSSSSYAGYFAGPIYVNGTISQAGKLVCLEDGTNCLATSSYWTLSGSNIYNNNAGNVGVGTNAPAGKLTISGVGGSAAAAGMEWHTCLNPTGYCGWSGRIYTGVPSGGWATAPFVFAVPNGSGGEIQTMTLLNGAVGILTSVPNNALEVNGNVGLVNGNPMIFLGPSNGAMTSINYHTIGYAASANYHVSGSAAGDMTIGARGGQGMVFGTNTSGTPVARMYINGAGNIGMGTVSPGFKLAVAQDMTMGSDVIDGTAQMVIQGASTSGKKMLLGYDTNGNGFGFIKAGYQGNIWTALALQPNGGTVGIATTSPAGQLDINLIGTSNAITTISSYPANAQMRIGCTSCGNSTKVAITYNGQGGGGAALEFGRTASSWDTYMAFYTNTGTTTSGQMFERMRILPSGRVGIGTAAPNAMLQVAGDIYANGTAYANGYALCQSNGTNCPSSSGITGSGSTNYVAKFTGTSSIGNSLIYDNGSYVGVNTASPSYTLDVNGTIRAGAYALLSTGGGAGYYQDATNGAYRAIVGSGTTNGYYFQTNGGAATTMYVGLGGTYNGRVGVGTNTPSYALHVVGNVYSSGTAYANGYALCQSNGTNCPSSGGYWTASGSDIYSNNSGGVGIGTSAPSPYKLRVNGGTRLSSTTSENQALMVTSPYVGILVASDGETITAVPTEGAIYALSDAGTYAIKGDNSSAGVGVYGSSWNGYGVQGYSYNSYGVYATTSAANTPAVYGIGTSGPGVLGTSTNGHGVSGSSTNYNGVYGVGGAAGVRGHSNGTAPSLYATNAATWAVVRLQHGGNSYWDIMSGNNYTNSDLAFAMNGTERMRMNAYGELCIGYGASGNCTESTYSIKMAGGAFIGGNITFAASNPYINTGGSYFVAPGGAYFNSGTVYAEATMMLRGGLRNDSGSYLYLYGGTGGYTRVASSGLIVDNYLTANSINSNSSISAAGAISAGSISTTGSLSVSGTTYAYNTMINYSNLIVYGVSSFGGGYTAVSGDIGTSRSDGTGVIYLGKVNNRYLYYAGGYYELPGVPLYVAGTYYASDARLKKNVSELGDSQGLEVVKRLRPVSYNWIDNTSDPATQYGFIAQDVQKVMPELVNEKKDGMLNLNYEGLIAPIVKSIQEQQKEIEDLKKQIKEMKETVGNAQP